LVVLSWLVQFLAPYHWNWSPSSLWKLLTIKRRHSKNTFVCFVFDMNLSIQGEPEEPKPHEGKWVVVWNFTEISHFIQKISTLNCENKIKCLLLDCTFLNRLGLLQWMDEWIGLWIWSWSWKW
jgi:hypothetical protein